MLLPHNSFVLVADGRKMLLLCNEGDADRPHLAVQRKLIHENPADHEQKSDNAGQVGSVRMGQSGQFSPGGGSMDEVDFHQLEEDRFAADVADMLNRKALANGFETLVIAAPPHTLGELRKHLHKETEARLTAEIPKDLTGHSVPDILIALQNEP